VIRSRICSIDDIFTNYYIHKPGLCEHSIVSKGQLESWKSEKNITGLWGRIICSSVESVGGDLRREHQCRDIAEQDHQLLLRQDRYHQLHHLKCFLVRLIGAHCQSIMFLGSVSSGASRAVERSRQFRQHLSGHPTHLRIALTVGQSYSILFSGVDESAQLLALLDVRVHEFANFLLKPPDDLRRRPRRCLGKSIEF
jgi:hypothetical protein